VAPQSARRGEALLVAGSQRVRFEVVASAEEHALAITGVGGSVGIPDAASGHRPISSADEDADIIF